LTRHIGGLIGALLLTFALSATAADPDQPKRVLIVHSYAPDFGDAFAKELRTELERQLPGRLEFYEDWLVSARFNSEGDDAAFAGYLSALFASRSLDLLITLGGPAANFAQRYQRQLFPATPVLLTGVDERRLSPFALTSNETAVAHSRGDASVIADILRVLPQTTTLAVIIGNSAIEKYWVGQIRESARPFTDHLNLIFLNDLPTFDAVLRRAATLPAHSAIYLEMFFQDVKGTPASEDIVVAKLHAVADAPIFTHLDTYFGKGVVGGPMISAAAVGHQAASVAARILAGEHASDIKTPPIHLSSPRYDWRELKRWGITESSLPPESEILYREPTAWERYRWQILFGTTLMVLEATLILTLLYERRRRRNAEIEAHRRLSELAHMNRRSAVGELSASIAHELQQPLTAILSNAETLELILSRVPNLTDAQEILDDIKRDDIRASEVIKRVRRLLSKTSPEAHEVNLNDVVREVFEFLGPQAAARHITLGTRFVAPAPRVHGDHVQLQQVVLNLVINAMDAITSANSAERAIVGRTMLVNDVTAEVSIEDSGPGIPADKLHELFEPFFTTKDGGMGMGLSIARTIVEAHGGRIWADSERGGGAVFRLSLPLAEDSGETRASAERRELLPSRRMANSQ
jgi:signal transduction histidine kinase